MPKQRVVSKASAKTKTARAKGKAPSAKGKARDGVERVPMTGRLRTLGTEQNAERTSAPARSAAEEQLARKTLDTLRNEFERVFAIKDKLSAESKIGATEKGRDARRSDDKLRSLIASLEGMSRFALQMELVTPAESREVYAEAMKRGLYQGWR